MPLAPLERAALIRRRQELLALYRDADGPEQLVEVQSELDAITRTLKEAGPPPDPRPPLARHAARAPRRYAGRD